MTINVSTSMASSSPVPVAMVDSTTVVVVGGAVVVAGNVVVAGKLVVGGTVVVVADAVVVDSAVCPPSSQWVPAVKQWERRPHCRKRQVPPMLQLIRTRFVATTATIGLALPTKRAIGPSVVRR